MPATDEGVKALTAIADDCNVLYMDMPHSRWNPGYTTEQMGELVALGEELAAQLAAAEATRSAIAERVAELHALGATVVDLAAAAGVSRPTIYAALREGRMIRRSRAVDHRPEG